MIDVMLRAVNRTIWETVAEAQGLLIRKNIDEETYLVPVNGIFIDEIGPVVITPAVYDEDNNLIKQAIIDNRFHVNVRVLEPALSAPGHLDPSITRWEELLEMWRFQGVPGTPNANESSHQLYGIELIEGVKTPIRVWL